VPMRITWIPEAAGYDYWFGQALFARRSPVEYLPGATFSVPRNLAFYRCNEPGCWGCEARDCIRIACLGGSTTWGQGLKDEDTYPAQLETLLKNRSGQSGVQVVNLGLPGSTSTWGAQRSQYMADRFDPEFVILGYGGLNDSLHVHFRESGLRLFSPLMMLLRSSQVYRLVESTWFRFVRFPETTVRVTLEEYRENVLGMTEHWKQRGTKVIFLGEWSPKESRSDYGVSTEEFERFRELQRRLAGELDLPFVDPKECLAGMREPSFLPDGIHWSEEGCGAVAACLTEVIVQAFR
jgi:lysophospholipase L1-like esterase